MQSLATLAVALRADLAETRAELDRVLGRIAALRNGRSRFRGTPPKAPSSVGLAKSAPQSFQEKKGRGRTGSKRDASEAGRQGMVAVVDVVAELVVDVDHALGPPRGRHQAQRGGSVLEAA
jgi:hypothetical protein